MNKSRIIFILFFIASLIAILIYFIPDDKKEIKKQFAKLASAISIIPGENLLQIGLKINALSELFDNPCEIEAAHEWINGNYSPQEISSQIARTKMNFKTLTLKFYDISIVLKGNSAEANLTARLTATTKNNKLIEEVREIKVFLKKKDKKWLFTKFTVVETLKK